MQKFLLSGFADEISPDWAVQMDVLQKLGMSYIEPRGVNGINVSSLTEQQAKEAKKQMDAAGIRVSSIGSPIGKIGIEDDFQAHMDLFCHTLEIAKWWEADRMRIFSFYLPQDDAPERYRDAVFERMFRLIEKAKEYGVTLLHENERGIYGEKSAQCYELAKEFYSDHFQLVFDPANYVLCGEADCMQALRLLYPYTTYFHIKDAVKREEKVVPAGKGDGKLREILQYAKDQGYHGFLSLEPHLAHFTGVDGFDPYTKLDQTVEPGEATFRLAKDALEELLDTLQ